MSPLTRRTALGAIGGIAGLVVASGAGLVVYCARQRDERPAADRLGLAFDEDPADAIRVGRMYLAAHPHEHDAARLARAIADASVVSHDAVRCPASAASALAMQSIAEFRAGHVVWVNGWMLGRTEARVCALTALRADRRHPPA